MSKYGIILASICIFDLAATIIGMQAEVVRKEGNFFMALVLANWNIGGLVAIKLILTILPIYFLEKISHSDVIKRRKIKIENCYKLAIYGYIFIWVSCVILFEFYLNL